MSSEFIDNLVKKAQTGDVQAFGSLYEMFSKDMYRFAWYYTGNSGLAEEAVSNAVLSAFKNICLLKKAESFKPWLFKILYNECKKAQKEKIISLNFTEYTARSDMQYIAGDSDEIIALRNAFKQLSDEEKEILILYHSLGYTTKEISSLTGIRHSTLRSKISRATEKLRHLLSM